MATSVVFSLCFIASVVSGLPASRTDEVLTTLSPGPRYQYMSGPDGAELVDLWVKTSDLLASARYNPAVNNGYHLFTRQNPQVSQPIPYGAHQILKASNFNPARKTVFIVHGWKNTPHSLFNVQMVNAYVTAEDVNLIMVDWSIGAEGSYLSSLLNVARSGLPTSRTDEVLTTLSPGPRYQYMSGPDGAELVDLWVKTSDLLASARYNPAVNNGYHLFTRQNPQVSQPIPYGAHQILKASNFNPARKTVFIVHGWKNTPYSLFNVQMVNAYVTAEDVNLIMVDWSIGAEGSYLSSLLNVARSAEHVANFISWLNAASGASLQNYHLVGHSLGGHQAGIIGRLLGGHLPYITCLDPAMPGWVFNPDGFKATDGIYTEVMHTNGGVFGRLALMGDVDFYPNGGTNMPGCGDNDCSHHRAIYYMAESLTRGGFTGRRCDDLAAALAGNCSSTDTLKMGGPTAKTGSTGIYHLRTNAGTPFSQD